MTSLNEEIKRKLKLKNFKKIFPKIKQQNLKFAKKRKIEISRVVQFLIGQDKKRSGLTRPTIDQDWLG